MLAGSQRVMGDHVFVFESEGYISFPIEAVRGSGILYTHPTVLHFHAQPSVIQSLSHHDGTGEGPRFSMVRELSCAV